MIEQLTDCVGRERILEESGFNTLNISPDRVELDLQTDSWSELSIKEIKRRMRTLSDKAETGACSSVQNISRNIKSLFPYDHFILLSQGRLAESFMCSALGKKDLTVIQNLLFPTTRYHQINNRLMPLEIPVKNVFDSSPDRIFRGNLDVEYLSSAIKRQPVSAVYVETGNNASGGYPVAMENIKEVGRIAGGHHIPLILDATRIVENAVFIKRYEKGHEDKTIFEIIHEFCSYSDGMTASLSKDFGTNKGGILAVNDERIYRRALDTELSLGSGLSVMDKKVLGCAIDDRPYIENMVIARMNHVRLIHEALTKNNIPVVEPAGGHCILLDTDRISSLRGFVYPRHAFLAWLYCQTGIRAGIHAAGMQKAYSGHSFIRLAIPLGLDDDDVKEISGRIINSFKQINSIADMEKVSLNVAGLYGVMKAHFRPLRSPL